MHKVSHKMKREEYYIRHDPMCIASSDTHDRL